MTTPRDSAPRLFVLDRMTDPSGVSGTGIVADGVEWPDGTCAVRWRTEHKSTTIYDSIAAVQAIHGHGGRTLVRFTVAEHRSTEGDPVERVETFNHLLALAFATAVVCLALGVVLYGCPRPVDCTPGTQRCEADTPVVCSAEGRSWRVSGEPRVTCSQVGGVCRVEQGRAWCARPIATDGGAP